MDRTDGCEDCLLFTPPVEKGRNMYTVREACVHSMNIDWDFIAMQTK